ncbi:MAG: GAF domain-containing protein [Proteobacteria bacterium]|nr:GAF domain-containing protein [Pseudomonadota bacterium]
MKIRRSPDAETRTRRPAVAGVLRPRQRAIWRRELVQQGCLVELARAALEGLELQPLLHEASQRFAVGLGVDLAGIWTLDDSAHELVLTAATGWPDAAVGSHRIPLSSGSHLALAAACATPHALAAEDLAASVEAGDTALLVEPGARSAVAVVIHQRGKPFGLLAAHSRRRRRFPEAELRFAETTAELIGVALGWRHRQDALRDWQRSLLGGVVSDLVERRAMAAALARAEARNRALQQAHDELERVAVAGELAGIMAHEVRTPLNALSINAQLAERALRRGGVDETGRALELLGTLRGEIERINGLLHEYLQVLRRPAGHPPRRFSLPQALRDALRFVEPKARDCQVKLELTLAADVEELLGDEARLRQVLLNIVLNAIQAMPRGGTVELSTARVGDHAQLIIRDTGPGIGSEAIKRIFQPFVTTKDQGTGLGLAICSRLVREMGGTIVVASPPGEGACFEIRLPLDGPPAAAGAGRQQPDGMTAED